MCSNNFNHIICRQTHVQRKKQKTVTQNTKVSERTIMYNSYNLPYIFLFLCSYSDYILQLNPEKDHKQYFFKKILYAVDFSATGFLQLQLSQFNMDYSSFAFCNLTDSLVTGITTGVERGDAIVKLKAIFLQESLTAIYLFGGDLKAQHRLKLLRDFLYLYNC